MRTLRVLSFGVMATLLAGGGNALACRGLQWERTIFFDEVPANIDVPAIVQVTITEMVTMERYDQVGVARVHRVIKDRSMARRSRSSQCPPPAAAGSPREQAASSWER